MDINTYLKEKFDKEISTVLTDKGLTNDIYSANIDGMQCMIRVPKNDVESIINVENEKKVLKLIKTTDLDVNELYYFDDSRVRITEYVENKEFSEVKSNDSIVKTAVLIKKFHDYKFKIDSEFNPLEMFRQYYSNIRIHLYDLDEYLYICDDLENIDNPHYLCHNDLVSGNILFSEGRTYLIDYEYAADNDPLFDITSFTTENNLNDEEAKLFYQTYFDGHIDTKTTNEILCFERFQNLLWLCWANMMYDNRKDEVYKKIADIKYKQLKHSVRKEKL